MLCGKKVGESEDKKVTKRDGSGIGYDLCNARAHIWIENAIPGISDGLGGVSYVRDKKDQYKMD